MKINVKGPIRDLLAFRRLVPTRRKRFVQAPLHTLGLGPVNRLAQRLHPECQDLVIADVRDETHTTKTYKLVADPDSDTQWPTALDYSDPGVDTDYPSDADYSDPGVPTDTGDTGEDYSDPGLPSDTAQETEYPSNALDYMDPGIPSDSDK